MSNKPNLFSQEYQKQPSETHRYKHIHTGEYCTFAAYVAEYLILRRSEKLSLPRPSYKFWTKGDPNHWTWLKQFQAANHLSKEYSEEAILKAIKSPEFNRLLLIGLQKGRGWQVNPKFIPILKKYQDQVDKDTERKTTTFKENSVSRKKTYGKGSLIGRLRNYDNKDKE